MQEFLNLDQAKLSKFRNCGNKTIGEIVKFQKKLRKKVAPTSKKKVDEKKRIPSLFEHMEEDSPLFESIRQVLSKRAHNVIVKNEIDSIKKFMGLTSESMRQVRNCSRKTVAEIIRCQQKILESAQKIERQDKSRSVQLNSGLASTLKTGDFLYELSGNDKLVNPEAPFSSLENWVLEISKKSERRRRVFMLRMGMLGSPRMTLEQIGELLGITKERVRQIINRLEHSGRQHIHQRKLRPLIKRALEIVKSRGGRIKNSTLVSLLLAHGPDGELLRYATPFIEFLGTLRDWEDAGLKVGENGVVFTNEFDGIIRQLSYEIVGIAKENADEVINKSLWSITFKSLKKMTSDWVNMKYPNEAILELSDTAIHDALLLCQEEGKKRGDRVYSNALWILRFGKVANVVEVILRHSKEAMHFSEVFSDLKAYRPDDDSLSERYIHAALGNNKNILLWDRGTFIHKKHMLAPSELINAMEEWILDKLGKEVPFISVYGVYKFFERKCLEANIPNETALYSILKEASHPRIAYPWVPYIYHDKGTVRRIPAAFVAEQYIKDSGGAVSYGDLKSFITNTLFLKEFQFNQIITSIPNTMRTNNGGFLYVDSTE
jgi:hypothetical protein